MRPFDQSRSSALGGLCLTACFAVALPTLAWAQAQEPGGLGLSFGIQQGLYWKDNPDLDVPASGSESSSRTQLRFGIVSETRTQRLAFDAKGTFVAGHGSEKGLVSPSVNLSYKQFSASSTLELAAFLREADVSTLDFINGIDGLGAPVTLAISGTGIRRQTGATAKLSFGQDASFGGSFSLGLTNSAYFNTTDPGLIDNRRTNADLSLRFDLTETTTATARLSGSRLKNDGAAAEDTKTLSLGLSQDRPDGAYTAAFAATRSENGTRQSLRFGRDLDLPAGKLSINLGFARPISGSVEAIGALDWRQEFAHGSVNIGLSRDVTSSDSDTETQISRFTLSYSHDLTPTLGLNLSAGIQDSKETASGFSTTTTDLNASLRKQLAQDWGITFGATRRIRDKDVIGRATSTTVFLTLSRDFEFYP